MKNIKLLPFLLFGLLMWSGCDVINPEEEIPSYLHVEPFDVTTSTGEGSNSHQIIQGFVFVEGSFLGVYNLPATFPILGEGLTRIEIFPGIADNGIVATPEIYPFYALYQEDIELTRERTDTVFPGTFYVDNAKFSIVENFENTLQDFRDDIDGDDVTTIELTQDDVFEGASSAKIVLTKDNPIFQVGSIRLDDLPVGTQGVYIELNYKTEVPFEVGLYYSDNLGVRISDFQHGLNIKTTWNKVYINMTPEFSALQNIRDFRDFQIGFRALMATDDNGNFLDGTRTILLDNVKMVNF